MNSKENINIKIEQVQSVKQLGIDVDKKLNFKDHIQFVPSKIAQHCGLDSCTVSNIFHRKHLFNFYNLLKLKQ